MLVPGVNLISIVGASSLVGSSDIPVWLDDATSVLSSTAVAALVEVWVVEVSLSVDDVHVARGGFEALGRSAVSVVGSIDSVNSEGLLGPTVVPVSGGVLVASEWDVHVLLKGGGELIRPRLRDWLSVSESGQDS